METKTTIYALFGPREPDEIRYVGKALNLRDRIYAHKADAKRGTKRYVYNWIRKLQSQEVEFEAKVLEIVMGDSWADRERHWVSYYKELGHKLTNLSEGGEGRSCQHSEETKRKIGDGNRGKVRPAETITSLSESHKGFKPTDETRLKLSEAHKGKPRDEETKRKIGDGNRGKIKSKELIEQMIEVRKGVQSNKPVGKSGFRYVQQYGNSKFRVRIKIGVINHDKGGFLTPESANEYALNYIKNLQPEATQNAA